MRRITSLPAICLLVATLSPLTRADIIFSGSSGALGGIYNIQPGSGSDYTLPAFNITVTPYLVTYTLTSPASARALSLLFFDIVAFGFQPFDELVTTSFTGTGPNQALLDYNVSVGGTFTGTGAQSGETTHIDAKIGSILNTPFDKTYSNSINGGSYTLNYGFAPVLGQVQVGAGVDVTPHFGIPDFKLEADTAGFASARNIWTTGTITESLTELALPVTPIPEPSYFAAVGGILVLLGLYKYRSHGMRPRALILANQLHRK
jgi:hypothetical protein